MGKGVGAVVSRCMLGRGLSTGVGVVVSAPGEKQRHHLWGNGAPW